MPVLNRNDTKRYIISCLEKELTAIGFERGPQDNMWKRKFGGLFRARFTLQFLQKGGSTYLYAIPDVSIDLPIMERSGLETDPLCILFRGYLTTIFATNRLSSLLGFGMRKRDLQYVLRLSDDNENAIQGTTRNVISCAKAFFDAYKDRGCIIKQLQAGGIFNGKNVLYCPNNMEKLDLVSSLEIQG